MNMTKINAIRTNTLNMGTEKYTSQSTDAKGRVIGTSIAYFEFDYEVRPESVQYGYYGIFADNLGRRYAFYPQATRDGQRYGASQSEQHFAE